MGKVVSIDYNVAVREDLVGFLEFLADEVRAGRVDGVAVATVLSEDRGIGTFCDFAFGRERPFTMMGALHHLQRRVDRIYCEEPGDEE